MEQLLRWQVGDVRITRVQEIEAPGMRFIIPNTTIDNLIRIPWLTPFLAPNGDAVGRVHALTLEVQLGHNGSRYGRWLNVRMSFSWARARTHWRSPDRQRLQASQHHIVFKWRVLR